MCIELCLEIRLTWRLNYNGSSFAVGEVDAVALTVIMKMSHVGGHI